MRRCSWLFVGIVAGCTGRIEVPKSLASDHGHADAAGERADGGNVAAAGDDPSVPERDAESSPNPTRDGGSQPGSGGGGADAGPQGPGSGTPIKCGDVARTQAPAPASVVWEQVLSTGAGNGILVDPAIPSNYYVFYELGALNNSPQRVQKSTDFGRTWRELPNSELNGDAWGVAIDPNPDRCKDKSPCPPPTMYRPAGYGFNNPDGSALGMYKSVDDGLTWVNIFKDYADGVLPAPGGGTVIAPQENGSAVDFYQAHILTDDAPNHVLFTYHYGKGQVVETKDGGETFEVHMLPGGSSHYAFAFDAVTWLLISQETEVGTFRTTTAGRVDGKISPEAWHKVDAGGHCHGAFTPWVDPTDCSVYFPTSSGLMRTRDQGATWEKVSDTGCTVSGTPNLLFVSSLFNDNGYRLDMRTTPPTKLDFKFPTGWQGIAPYGSASSFDEERNEWVIHATQYGGGVWRTTVPH